MSIVRSVLFALALALTPLSPLASSDVAAARHAGHAAASSSAFVEAVRQATERFRDVRNAPPAATKVPITSTACTLRTSYLNYYLEADAVDPAAVAYGPNLERLRALKTKWDPDNFFRQNVNILSRSNGRAY